MHSCSEMVLTRWVSVSTDECDVTMQRASDCRRRRVEWELVSQSPVERSWRWRSVSCWEI